ncbi:uncharacterized protein LOC114280334 [Camellia sinensis]|uniref:uncharacterized protein LOC114280334 n=1 Tax=Camellia sinensis TaxID=4442 RepID=UPI001035A7AC|nr:uncharacterized protein LOC114280334 [Camellia sinensis]
MAVESKRLGCVIVSVDGSEESMNALRWALDNLKLRSPSPDSSGGHLVIFHVQSPPSITAGLNPGAIPFGGPSDLEVPAFTAAIEAHQRKISDAIMKHALQICSDKNVRGINPTVYLRELHLKSEQTPQELIEVGEY